MWAVVEILKKQYIVRPNDKIETERLEQKEGEIVFDKVLLLVDGDNIKVGTPYVAGAQVKATITGEEKDDKVIIGKFKRRKKYRRRQGHRQIHSILNISTIS